MELVALIAIVTSLVGGIGYIVNLRWELAKSESFRRNAQNLFNEYHAKYEEQRLEAHLLAQRLEGNTNFTSDPLFCAGCDEQLTDVNASLAELLPRKRRVPTVSVKAEGARVEMIEDPEDII